MAGGGADRGEAGGSQEIPLLSLTGRLSSKRAQWQPRWLAQHSSTAPLPRSRQRIIVRVDRPGGLPGVPDLPVLDIGEIIRAKDGLAADPSASANSERTLASTPVQTCSHHAKRASAGSSSSSSAGQTAVCSIPGGDPVAHLLMGSGGDTELAESLCHGGEPERRQPLRHDYFTVATIDGCPAIPQTYRCPIALCREPFAHFAQLQAHWTTHPWNRGGILTPVCEGGMRRLGWWEHKRKFFGSLLRGRPSPEFPEHTDSAARAASRGLRKRATSIDAMCRFDYGDISLFGSKTYCVSPRVVPMWQVVQWEAQRVAPVA
ncbi:hypothetical protein H4R20_004840 [Coemansia guatemalensis]|uniref:C2H2-type domain-containing protein n=1 Tax=Coemansia guatemalensis TaxID=2761395 RepID=A0A9W8HXX7_9FUNG|nr:hypothetical protein H4R20_004840 [Coemansia guatemalensis]